MTNHLSWKTNWHACYFAVAAWLTNLCNGFSNRLDTISLKTVSL